MGAKLGQGEAEGPTLFQLSFSQTTRGVETGGILLIIARFREAKNTHLQRY